MAGKDAGECSACRRPTVTAATGFSASNGSCHGNSGTVHAGRSPPLASVAHDAPRPLHWHSQRALLGKRARLGSQDTKSWTGAPSLCGLISPEDQIPWVSPLPHQILQLGNTALPGNTTQARQARHRPAPSQDSHSLGHRVGW